MLLIRNCHLIDPASGTDGMRDILVEGEQIAAWPVRENFRFRKKAGGRAFTPTA